MIATNQVYPLVSGKTPWQCSALVSITFLAIIAAGIGVGTLSSHDAGTKSFGDFLRTLAAGWGGVGGLITAFYVFTPNVNSTTGHPYTHMSITPLAGTWLVWLAMGLASLPAAMS
ncbi:hypothetical protein [Kitasatospora kifunensis]|uniref:Uncharacterized protein n=1 Tax=Kitasatospora kifunensis TaxID=58351 RepID=A0A7W7RAZ7_KITKI|nr:hypothetical protein [Kitasatospora kifunensis]MBB4928672.1 hypothetical protein [Kitasatospora kifunensis]